MQPTLILVGGFLGAGKTTWLLAAARRLCERGRAVGVVLNDQGGELVDTRLARAAGFAAEEVAGGCFCCRLSEFVRAARRLPRPEVILAEPVGSCTDLVATVVRPLGREFRIAPLTVLVDAMPDSDPLLEYLFRRQIAEADIVLLSKCDLGTRHDVRGRPVSALTGEGLDDWLDAVLAGQASNTAAEVDYALYAQAEAALAWLDWRADVRLRRALTPAALIGPLLDAISATLGPRVAHLKVFAQSAGGWIKASICHNGGAPFVDGALDAPPALRHEIVLNLRAAAAPEALDAALDQTIACMPGRISVVSRKSFRPRAPVPERRIV